MVHKARALLPRTERLDRATSSTLKRMEKVLSGLATACKGRGPISEYPILEALEADGERSGKYN